MAFAADGVGYHVLFHGPNPSPVGSVRLMRDIPEAILMALSLLLALGVAWMAAVFLLTGFDIEEFRRILHSMWENGIFG